MPSVRNFRFTHTTQFDEMILSIELTTGLMDKADLLRRDGIRFFSGLMETTDPSSVEVGFNRPDISNQ